MRLRLISETALDGNSIRLVFEKYPVQDSTNFKDYLCRIIPSFLHGLNKDEIVPPEFDENPWFKAWKARTNIICKVFLLRQILLACQDPRTLRNGLFFSIFMITKVLPRKTWDMVFTGDLRRHNYRVPRDGLYWGRYTVGLAKELFTFLDTNLTPPESDEDEWWQKQHEFLDAAAMYRELFATYSSHDCSSPDPEDPLNEHDEYHLSDLPRFNSYNESKCFHSHTVRLLRALNRHAHRETHEKVLLASRSRLPVELTDMILPYAIEAEDLPTDEELIRHAFYRELMTEYRYNHRIELKELYHCDHMSSLPFEHEQRSYNAIIRFKDVSGEEEED
jgi:hypothetical protein